MAYLVLTISLLFASFAHPLVETASSNNSQPVHPIDSCWRGKENWATNRQALANCSKGFGQDAIGGRHGAVYEVINPSDDPKNPRPGTLRYGINDPNARWITFASDMVIALKSELMVTSFKTIDGRGAQVEIAKGPCLRIKGQSHIIIHGLNIHDCRSSGKDVRDGKAISIFQSSHIWIDHCTFSRSPDGFIDVINASTAITISNNYFSENDKVILLGHDDNFVRDNNIEVTIAFNHFGPGLVESMPWVRRGYVHVANNRYDEWKMYAIGGSVHSIIFSEGNYYIAPYDPSKKQVTKRMGNEPDSRKWKWSSSRDVFMNRALFGTSGLAVRPSYKREEVFQVVEGARVPALTTTAGHLPCQTNFAC